MLYLKKAEECTSLKSFSLNDFSIKYFAKQIKSGAFKISDELYPRYKDPNKDQVLPVKRTHFIKDSFCRFENYFKAFSKAFFILSGAASPTCSALTMKNKT